MKTLVIAMVGASLGVGCGYARTPEAYRDDTGAVLGPKNEAIRACYDGVIKTNTTAGGRVTVRFVVDNDQGTLGNVMVDKANTTAPNPVADCVTNNINVGLALSPVDKNKGEGTWVYEFTPPVPVGPAIPGSAPAPGMPRSGGAPPS